MSAGESARQRAQRARDEALALARRAADAYALARRFDSAAEGERQVAAQLVTLTARGWRMLVDRRWPGTKAANVDMIMIGPSGVFVIDVKNWRDQPVINNECLFAGDIDRSDEITKLLAMTRQAQIAVECLGLSPVAVQSLMVFTSRQLKNEINHVTLVGSNNAVPHLIGQPRRLTSAQIKAVARHLEEMYPAYNSTELPERPRENTTASTLFDAKDVEEAYIKAELAKPIERWMTFLHPDQVALVRRNFGGPARISGAAGTGKTVVGLHRAVYLAQQTLGRVLYVTFANNLPRVQAEFCHRLAPTTVADRIEFTSLHSWAKGFLYSRGIETRLNRERADSAYNVAWARVGKNSPLFAVEASHLYWKEEIDHVIKGRGILAFETYAALERRGRRTMLPRDHRRAVWKLYQEYGNICRERNIHDFNDILSMALAEARRETPQPAYSAVIVDEVQDLTLVGVQLLHALIGDAPNGLLVIGDGQQAVYPGGFRLSDAGVAIKGARGQVLRVNYRNAEPILRAALELVAQDSFDDIDGTTLAGLRDVDISFHDGHVYRVTLGTEDEHDDRLIKDITALTQQINSDTEDFNALADTAILCSTFRDIDYYRRILAKAGIPVLRLEEYSGNRVQAVKIGTYRRSKGLDFKHVFLPAHDKRLRGITPGAGARERELLARRQLFVAMTRARDTLWLGSVDGN